MYGVNKVYSNCAVDILPTLGMKAVQLRRDKVLVQNKRQFSLILCDLKQMQTHMNSCILITISTKN